MRCLADRRNVSSVSIALGAGTLLLFLFAVPCSANISPESALLIHVQPVSGWCQTPITSCSQIVRTTTANGPLEFLIFFTKMYSWQGQQLSMIALHADLVWPDTWELVDFQPCSGFGSLEPEGSTHALDFEWWDCPPLPTQPLGVLLVGRLVFNVNGPGRLDFAPGLNPVHLGCWGNDFTTYSVGVDAEAGMDCEYTTAACAGHEVCVAVFQQPELDLSAPPGSATWGEVDFWAENYAEDLCPLTIDARASWAHAQIDPVHTHGHAHLWVRADASGLTPGTYETSIQLSSSMFGVARCLPVVFTVAESASAPDNGTPAVQTTSWGRVKSLYR